MEFQCKTHEKDLILFWSFKKHRSKQCSDDSG